MYYPVTEPLTVQRTHVWTFSDSETPLLWRHTLNLSGFHYQIGFQVEPILESKEPLPVQRTHKEHFFLRVYVCGIW